MAIGNDIELSFEFFSSALGDLFASYIGVWRNANFHVILVSLSLP